MKPDLRLCIVIAICCCVLSAMTQSGISAQRNFTPGLPVLPPTPVFPEQPLNDTFANRAVFYPAWPLGTNWISGSLSNATSEEGEPFIDGVSSGQTVWGTWTAPSNGIVTLYVNADAFSPLLTVYARFVPTILGSFPGMSITPPNVFTNLSLVASNNYLACYEDGQCGCHWRERNQITFRAASGQAYQICVDSAIITDASITLQSVPLYTNLTSTIYTNSRGIFTNGPSVIYKMSWKPIFTTNVLDGGDVQLGLQFSPAPPNDDFEKRAIIHGSRLNFVTSNAGASKESGEPDHSGNPGGSSVWFSWTAPASGRVTLSTNEVPVYAPPSSTGGGTGVIITTVGPPTCGNLIDQNPPPVFYPVFAAYTGYAVDSLTSANCLPAALDAFPNMVEFDAVKGQTYQITFDGNLGTTGDIPLYLALTKHASNDNFANRIPLHGIYAVATSYNAGATHQANEPVFGDAAGKTIWWSWTAPVSGTVAIDLGGSDYSFPVAIFTGTTLGRLQMVAEASGGVSFEAIEGKAYQIAVSDLGGLTGLIELKLQAPIVELPLMKTAKTGFNSALLFYAASAGQVILLQHSNMGTNWENVQQVTAVGNKIQFLVRPPPTGNGPYYRAVVVDSSLGNHSDAQWFQ